MAAHELNSSRFAIPGVPVFMYHDVCASPTSCDRYSLPLATFRDHLSFLQQHGFALGDLSSLSDTSGGRQVVLTFDDGLASHYERVFPALQESRFRAIFFATTSLVGTPGYLTWSQIREMSDAGMMFGSHGHYHIDHSGLDRSTVRRQLRCSRMTLEDAIGKPVCSFSAPYGFLTRPLVEAALRAGFQWICSSCPWLVTQGASVISRIAVYSDTDVPRLSAIANGSAFPLLARLFRHALLHLPKRALLRTWPERLSVNVQEEPR